MKTSQVNEVRQKLYNLRRTFNRYYDSIKGTSTNKERAKKMLFLWAWKLLLKWDKQYHISQYPDEYEEYSNIVVHVIDSLSQKHYE
jgi:hypothetical protein